jgi:hypothetical protein
MCMQVLLDVTSIAPDRILLLDSYFYVVVFHGSSIAQWRKDGFHLNPDHAHFKELLEVRRWPLLTQYGRPSLSDAPVFTISMVLTGRHNPVSRAAVASHHIVGHGWDLFTFAVWGA